MPILSCSLKDVSNNVKEFGGVSGSYSMELIIGDASISNPTLWHIGDVSLSFPEGSVSTPSQDYTYKVGLLLSFFSIVYCIYFILFCFFYYL